MSYLDIFEINNRDIALAIWFAILFVWVIRKKSIRQAFGKVLKVLTERVILVTLTLMILYIISLCYLLHALNIWEVGNLKDTIFWLFGSAFVLYVNINRVNEDGYILNAVIDSLKVAVLIEFFVNLYVFSIWIELLLVPLLFLLWGMLGYTSVYQQHKQVEDLLKKILGIVGLAILIFTIIRIVQNFHGFFSLDNLRDFLIPILLTIGFIPFLYFFGFYILYDSIFNRIRRFASNTKIALRAKLRIFWAFNLNLSAVRSWSHGMGILRLNSKSDIVDAINAHKLRGP